MRIFLDSTLNLSGCGVINAFFNIEISRGEYIEKVVSYYSNLSCKFRNLSNFLFFTIPVKLSALVNRAKIRKDLMEFYIVSKLVGINGTVEDFEAFSLHYIILCSVFLNCYGAK